MKAISENTKVYVDLDGVLADLFNHIGKIHDVEHYNEMTKKQWEDFFKETDAYHLFRDLPAFPNIHTLLNLVISMFGEYKILSSPLNFDPPNSIRGKQEWIAKHLDPKPVECIFDHEKYKYAINNDGSPNILIDDFRSNIKQWDKAGGIGIKFQNDENTLVFLREKLQSLLLPKGINIA